MNVMTKYIEQDVDPHNNNQYLGTFWDPMGSGSSNGVFRAVYNADLNGTNKAMVY
ncbi:hypothetical protein JJQ72_19145 [Paenibacillus sp. F411]|uniref:hypothetical protein n=1 Tax=Paenibacillus sp. F411 TaxID=2820239 RepID=UPI001AB00D68|nr:hypothetical protein [Paenibacillus sp. F411]MBO2946096.1 hypothetical protein [Paenibacillus sp. F411]